MAGDQHYVLFDVSVVLWSYGFSVLIKVKRLKGKGQCESLNLQDRFDNLLEILNNTEVVTN